jgi:hypothetical protein
MFTDESFPSDDDDDDDKWEICQKRLCIALLLAHHIMRKKGRKKKRCHRKRHQNRWLAEMLMQEGIDDGLFPVEYCMSPQSFQKLVFLIPHEDFGPKNPPKT